MTGVEVLALGWVLLSRKGKGGSAGAPAGKESDGARIDDGIRLKARAGQGTASSWAPIFASQGVPAALADAYARWAGIESSGNPRAVSSVGERGLFQCTKTTALKRHAYTQAEWDSMLSPATSNDTHAHLAMKLANWCWDQAKKHLTNAPTDYISAVWYAKLYHQRPADVKGAKLHGPALFQSRELKTRWANDPKRLHRLRAANVVAFGVPEP